MADQEPKHLLTARIMDFLAEIGLPVRSGPIEGKTFMPGITIHHGSLLIDETKLAHPGDLLHEAGHLAVIPAERRAQIHIDTGTDPADEMMAIAWSYAALVDLGLDPAVVFHADGYRGGSANIIENFTNGRYFAVPMLQWIGLTADAKRATELSIEPYPHMLQWLRD